MKKEKIILVLNGELPKKRNLISYIADYNKILCADGAANTTFDVDTCSGTTTIGTHAGRFDKIYF